MLVPCHTDSGPTVPRHAGHDAGEWSELCPEDAAENALSVARGFRVFSSYAYDVAHPDAKVWIITEADRSSTCVLLPEDY